MSTWRELLDQASGDFKTLLAEYITGLAVDATGDVPAYVEEATEFLYQWIAENAGADPALARRNMALVGSTLELTAMKAAVKMNKRTADFILRGVTLFLNVVMAAFQIATKAR
jgi:hypothetical protein